MTFHLWYLIMYVWNPFIQYNEVFLNKSDCEKMRVLMVQRYPERTPYGICVEAEGKIKP